MADTRRFGGSLPPRRPAPAVDARTHVIEEYRHSLQQVTCVCGWTGSSASVNGQPSDWTRHVAEGRTKGG